MEQLMQKLMMSKAIMDKSDQIKRSNGISIPNISVDNYDAPVAKYNLPTEFVQENQTRPVSSSPMKTPTIDAIKNSKLPDAIKKLMIEHPIQSPQMTGPTLTNELVEKASRLMKEKSNEQQQIKSSPSIDISQIEKIVENTVRKVLKENGLLTESEEKTNETFSFRVGKHIFEGKVTKIKKVG
jgi:hypothetical protein